MCAGVTAGTVDDALRECQTVVSGNIVHIPMDNGAGQVVETFRRDSEHLKSAHEILSPFCRPQG